MKMIFVIPGIVILFAGIILLSSSSALGLVAGFTGMSTTNTISSPPEKLVVVPYGNFTSIEATIPQRGTLSLELSMNPAGLNIFVMNQGNFTMFMKNETSFPIKSLFNVSSPTSLSFPNGNTANQTYYFVIQNNIPGKETSDVLIHYVITSEVASSITSYIPLIAVVIGLALIVLGGLPTRNDKPEEIIQRSSLSSAPLGTKKQQAGASPQAVTRSCKFCGAKMQSNEFFCSSCKRAQG